MLNVLILGASGLLGNVLFWHLSENCHKKFKVWGTFRSQAYIDSFPTKYINRALKVNDLLKIEDLENVISDSTPDVIINCLSVGQNDFADTSKLLSIFAIFPQKLNTLCRERSIRLIQISSDGVYSGSKGFYSENDLPDFIDDYGMSKFLGEISGENCLTIRSSFIGHDFINKKGLVDWFLSQKNYCKGYQHYIFSGFPVNVFSEILADKVLENKALHGIYHIASKPISKYDLLHIIANVYEKEISIKPDRTISINRSLNSEKFLNATGYEAPNWNVLIKSMNNFSKIMGGRDV